MRNGQIGGRGQFLGFPKGARIGKKMRKKRPNRKACGNRRLQPFESGAPGGKREKRRYIKKGKPANLRICKKSLRGKRRLQKNVVEAKEFLKDSSPGFQKKRVEEKKTKAVEKKTNARAR